MAIITLDGLRGYGAFEISQARYDLTESSDSTGAEATRLLAPPRWRVSAQPEANMTLADAAWWESLVLRLRGRVNHLAVHDPLRPLPRGTLRGVPTLGSTAAAGAATLTLAGCLQGNYLLNAISFNAASWVKTGVTLGNGQANYYDASDGSVTADAFLEDVPSGNHNVAQTAAVPAAVSSFTLSVEARAVNRTDLLLQLREATGGTSAAAAFDLATGTAGSVLSGANMTGASAAIVALGDGWYRCSLTCTKANAATSLTAYIIASPDGSTTVYSGAGNHAFALWGAMLKPQSFAVPYVRPTLLNGDWLQAGTGVGTSQLVKCVQDATADDLGVMTVTVEPPLRIEYAGGTVVTLDRPVAYYKQTSEPRWAYRGGRLVTGFALDLLESWA